MYPSTTLFIALGQFAIVILVLFSYPLQVHPCRNCLDKVFTRSSKANSRPSQPKVVISSPTDNGRGSVEDERETRENDGEEEEHDSHAPSEMSALKFTLITAGIISTTFVIAYLVDDLQVGKLPQLSFTPFSCQPWLSPPLFSVYSVLELG